MREAALRQRQAHKLVMKLTWVQRVLAAVALVLVAVFGLLFLIYNERIFAWLRPFAVRWRDLRGGWLIVWSLVFIAAFPPLIGYSTCLTIAGFLYGVPKGWCVVASATVLGSLGSFLLSRTLLAGYVHRLVEHDRRFAALALTLKHDGLKLLVMVRLCPLPYSLSNGAMSTFPTVHPLSFALATAIASPRLLIHVFIGSRLGALAEDGDTMDAGTKAVNYASIIGGGILGVLVGWSIYQRTMSRAKLLEAEEEERLRQNDGRDERPRDLYNDLEANAGFRNNVVGDEISLFENDPGRGNYHDDSADEDDNVFRHGYGDDDDEEGASGNGDAPAQGTER